MAEKYRKVKTDYWITPGILKMTTEERYLYLYLFTNPHISLAGVLRVGEEIMAVHTGLSVEKVVKTLQNLKSLDKIEVGNGSIWVKRSINHQNLSSPNLVKGIVRNVKGIRDKSLRKKVISEVSRLPELSEYFQGADCGSRGDRVGCGGSCDDYNGSGSGEKSGVVSVQSVKDEKKCENKYSADSMEVKLAKRLGEAILERKPDFSAVLLEKKRAWQKWAVFTDRMMRIDGRKAERVKEVIDWVQDNDFWQNNVLSTNKLRQQFDRLELQMRGDRGRRGGAVGATERQVF